jgi:hypothetical protein
MRPLQYQTWETFSVNWHTNVKIAFAEQTQLRGAGGVLLDQLQRLHDRLVLVGGAELQSLDQLDQPAPVVIGVGAADTLTCLATNSTTSSGRSERPRGNPAGSRLAGLRLSPRAAVAAQSRACPGGCRTHRRRNC